MVIFDVDGVLTRGEIIYDNLGRELKAFNVKDGLGVFLLRRAGIRVVLLTAKDSKALRRRAQDMGVKVYAGILPKESQLPQIRDKYKVRNNQICFVGDDLIDIGIMKKVGLPVAVADASPEVRKTSLYITRCRGGEGAGREVVELILKSQGLWDKALIQNWKITGGASG